MVDPLILEKHFLCGEFLWAVYMSPSCRDETLAGLKI